MKDKNLPALDPRLRSAADFVRPGAVVCDVGTDHAYLPIALILSGKCPRALATDVNASPLRRAEENAAACGVGDRMAFFLADGLTGVPLSSYGVRDLLVCGMGGELIARIVAEATYTRLPDVRLILQPMSSAVDLRLALARDGYAILDEKLSASAGKLYTCLNAVYEGVPRTPSPAEALLGAAHIARGSREPLFAPYLRREAAFVRRRRDGLRLGGRDAAPDDALLDELNRIAEKEGIPL